MCLHWLEIHSTTPYTYHSTLGGAILGLTGQLDQSQILEAKLVVSSKDKQTIDMSKQIRTSLLLEMPNEVLVHMIDRVDPFDVARLSLCCKRLHALCEDTLHLHKKRLPDYRVVHADRFRTMGRLPKLLEIVEEICIDDRIGAYAAEAFIDPFDLEDTAVFDPLDKRSQNYGITRSDMLSMLQSLFQVHGRHIRFVLRQSFLLTEEQTESYVSSALQGHLGVIFGILLAMLPNLRSLTLAKTRSSPVFGRILDQLPLVWNSPSRSNDISFTSRPLDSLLEAGLRETDIDDLDMQQDPDAKQDLNLLHSLSCLPNIKSVIGIGMFSEENLKVSHKIHNTSIEHVSLHGDGIQSGALVDFLSSLHSLKSFRLRVTFHNKSVYIGASPILRTLIDRAHTTLEHLDFILGRFHHPLPVEVSPCPSLTACKSLKEAVLDWRLFRLPPQEQLEFGDNAGCMEDEGGVCLCTQLLAHELLPSSIRHVTFKGAILASELIDLFHNFVGHRMDKLPSLRTITVNNLRHHGHVQRRKRLNILIHDCEQVDVHLLFCEHTKYYDGKRFDETCHDRQQTGWPL